MQIGIEFATIPPAELQSPDDTESQCLLPPGVKAKIVATPGFPQLVDTPNPPRYQVTPIPGAGIGLVATVDLEVGDLIVAERPLIVMTQALPGGQGRRKFHPNEWLRILVDRLRDENREEFFALHNCKGNTRPHVVGISDTNSVGIGALTGVGGECTAICKIISRANHR